jgi:DNA-binding NarL/FixJ family response regulator
MAARLVYAADMPRSSPYEINLTREERAALEASARKYTLSYRDVFRAHVVLLAAQGLRNDQIADRLNSRREIVSKWRKRFFDQRLDGLQERDRSGRRPVFPP